MHYTYIIYYIDSVYTYVVFVQIDKYIYIHGCVLMHRYTQMYLRPSVHPYYCWSLRLSQTGASWM